MDTLFRQLIYFGFFQAILLLLLFTFSVKHRSAINNYLIVLVLVLLVGLCGHLFYIEGLFGGSRRWVGLSEFSILFFGPTIYLFIKSSLSKMQFSYRELIHYLPGLFYCSVITFYYLVPPKEVILERIESGELFRVVNIIVGLGLLVNSTYFGVSVHHFITRKNALQERVSYHLSFRFLQNFLIAIGICLGIWLTVYFLSLGGFENAELDSRRFIWIAIVSLILFIMFYQLLSPEALRYKELFSKMKYANSKLSTLDLNRLKEDLETVMKSKKPFLNSKLLKSELAEMLDINSPELARLLNERIGMNFFEFINYYRIQEFIRLAQTNKLQEMTMLGLAQEAGFNSKATFNKSFKKIMGCSPTEYLKK